MVIEAIRSIKSEKSDLRKFGITIGTVLAIFGIFFFWREKDFYGYFLIIAGVFIVFGLVLPITLKPFHKVWMILSIVLGLIMTNVIMIILYYLVVTPIGLVARLVGTEFLDLKRNTDMTSYWIKKKPAEFDTTDYEKQF